MYVLKILLKKKYNFNNVLILKYNKNKDFLINLITNSLSLNHSLKPIDRLSYFARKPEADSLHYKYSTFLKLTCFVSLSNKVPNKQYGYSRFFLNKQMSKLVLSGAVK